MYDEKQALRVGAVVVGCLVVLALLLIRVGNLDDYLKDRRVVEVVFADGKGLPVGAPVLYQGMQIGTVKDIDVLPASAAVGPGSAEVAAPEGGRNWVLMTLDVENSDKYPLSYDDEVSIQVPLAMGDPDLRIMPTPAGAAYDGSGNPIVGSSGGDILTAVNEAMDEIGSALGDVFGKDERDKLKSAIGKAEGLIDNASKSVKTIDETVPTVALAITRVMGRAEITVDQLDKDLKEIAASAKKATDKLGVTIENLDGVVTSAGPKLDKSLDKADKILVSGDKLVKTLETEVKSVSGNANETLKEAKTLVQESREPLKKTLTEASSAAAESKKALAAATEAVVELRDILAENREKLRVTVSRVEQISGNLRSMSAEVRRQPWRLIRKPSKKEIRSVELATASDQAAVSAEELSTAVARLEAMLKSKETLVDSQLEAIDSAAKALQQTLRDVDGLQNEIEDERD
jgi:ABC-type transporter Mla subunit MlaD